MVKRFISVTLIALTLAHASVCVGASAADIYRKANPSVVTILTEHGQGSGFFFDKGQVVATNYHVIEGASNIRIRSSDGLEFRITGVLHQDSSLDLAILEVPVSGKPLTVDYDLPDVGIEAFSIGSPQGLSNTISSGIVSALREEGNSKFVQFTAPASPGSSGGPLLNEKGHVIGVVTWNVTRGQNLNFAVASSHLLDLLRNQAATVRTTTLDSDSKQSQARKVFIAKVEIVGRVTNPGMRVTIANYENCLVSKIDLNIQFIDEPVRNAPTMYRHRFLVQDVLNPRDRREIWIPIDAVRGHGKSDALEEKWYTRVKIEGYERDCS